jgi:hypothetical protein
VVIRPCPAESSWSITARGLRGTIHVCKPSQLTATEMQCRIPKSSRREVDRHTFQQSEAGLIDREWDPEVHRVDKTEARTTHPEVGADLTPAAGPGREG